MRKYKWRTPIIHHALIMAAGRGNRMRPFTDLIPKPMLPYRGDTLIGNSLKELKGCVDQVHITVGYKKAMLSEYLMARGVDTLINTEGHDNAWWITHTLMKYIDEPVLVLTTDNITKIDMDFLGSEYQRLGCPFGMLVPVKPIKGIDGDYIFHEKGVVTEIVAIECSDIYCSGIQVLNPNQIAAKSARGFRRFLQHLARVDRHQAIEGLRRLSIYLVFY